MPRQLLLEVPFTGTDGANLDADWQQWNSPWGSIRYRLGGTVYGASASPTEANTIGAKYIGSLAGSIGNDHFVDFAAKIDGTGLSQNSGVGVIARMADTDANRDGYVLQVSGVLGTHFRLTLSKFRNGARTVLFAAGSVPDIPGVDLTRFGLEVVTDENDHAVIQICQDRVSLGATYRYTDTTDPLLTGGIGVTHASSGVANNLYGRNLEAGNILPPAPPVLSSPTGVATGATTGSVGISTDEAGGTLYRLVFTGAEPDAATVKSTGVTSTPSGTGAQGPFAVTGLTAGLTYRTAWVHTGAEGDSDLVIGPAFYPGTWRPIGVSGTPDWTVTGAASAQAALSEDAPGSTAEYVAIADLTSTPKGGIVQINPMPAGDRKLSITVRRQGTGAVNVRVTPLDSALDPVASPVTQLVTDSWATYEMNFTVSAEATHALVEMWDAA